MTNRRRISSLGDEPTYWLSNADSQWNHMHKKTALAGCTYIFLHKNTYMYLCNNNFFKRDYQRKSEWTREELERRKGVSDKLLLQFKTYCKETHTKNFYLDILIPAFAKVKAVWLQVWGYPELYSEIYVNLGYILDIISKNKTKKPTNFI